MSRSVAMSPQASAGAWFAAPAPNWQRSCALQTPKIGSEPFAVERVSGAPDGSRGVQHVPTMSPNLQGASSVDSAAQPPTTALRSAAASSLWMG
jgi:hypothetical protein